MSPVVFFTVMILMVFGYGVYSCHDKVKKVKCLYEARDRSVEIKFVKKEANAVRFGDKKFRILPQFVSSYIERGGIHMFFPTRISFIRFNWASIYPASPDNPYNAEIVDDKLIDARETVNEVKKRYEELKAILVNLPVKEDNPEIEVNPVEVMQVKKNNITTNITAFINKVFKKKV